MKFAMPDPAIFPCNKAAAYPQRWKKARYIGEASGAQPIGDFLDFWAEPFGIHKICVKIFAIIDY